MTASFWVPGPLPGTNELIAAAKSGRGKGNAYSRLKAEWTSTVHLHAKAARLPRFTGRVMIRFRWLEAGKRRDPDNVAAGGRKLVLDGLVAAGVLPDDSWRYIQGWTDSFDIYTSVPLARGPGVQVTIHDYGTTVGM